MQETPSKQENQRKLILPSYTGQFYFAVGFFLIVTIATAFLYVYTLYQQSQIDTLEESIRGIEVNQVALESKKEISLALLLNKIGGVKESIDLVDVVEKFRDAASKASVQFQGFTLEENKIHTSLISTVRGENNVDSAYYILQMVSDYVRQKGEANGKNFRMKPVFSISGKPDKRMTEIDLEFVPALSGSGSTGVVLSNNPLPVTSNTLDTQSGSGL